MNVLCVVRTTPPSPSSLPPPEDRLSDNSPGLCPYLVGERSPAGVPPLAGVFYKEVGLIPYLILAVKKAFASPRHQKDISFAPPSFSEKCVFCPPKSPPSSVLRRTE